MWLLPLVWTGLCTPAAAQIITAPPPAALSGETIVSPPPGQDVVIYHVGLLGLLNKTKLEQIELQISPLATPLAAGLESGDIKTLRLIESVNHIFGDGDDTELNNVKSKDIVVDGSATVITDKGKATPVGLFPLPVGVLLRHYFVVAEIAANATDGHAFRVGAAVGHITVSTPATIGFPVWAANGDRVVVGGLEPVIGVSATSLDFASVPVGEDSTRSVTISNTGAADLTLTHSSDDPRFAGSPASLVVSPGSSADLDITYTPDVAASHSATFSLVHNGPDTPTTLDLAGEGSAGVNPPQITAQPNSHEYDPVLINTTGTLLVQVSNTGTSVAQISQIVVSNDQFAVTPAGGFTLNPGQTQQLTIIHQPTRLGPITGRVDLHVVGLSDPVPVLLSGFGASPGLSVSTSLVDFGKITFGEMGLAQLQLTNGSDVPIEITDISAADPQFTSDVDVVIVGAQQTITVPLRFQATSLGTKTTTLSIRHEADLTPISVNMRADATVALKNTSLSFGRTSPGQTAYLPVTIENPSGADVTIKSIKSDNPLFVPDCTTCVIPAGGSVDVLIAFTPIDESRQAALLSITHNPTVFVGIVGNDYPRRTSPGVDASGKPLQTLQVPFGGEWLASLLICLYAVFRRRAT